MAKVMTKISILKLLFVCSIVFLIGCGKGENEMNGEMTPLEMLQSKAYEFGCTTTVNKKKNNTGDTIKQFEDDGSYYDEVVLSAWFDESGNPKAEWLPSGINMVTHNPEKCGYNVNEFRFINGESFSMNDLKRTSEDIDATYAMILVDINKRETEDNEIILDGLDYISNTWVVIHGDFSQILNGDDLLVFAEYIGLATDDTPNYKGFLFEVINDRGIN